MSGLSPGQIGDHGLIHTAFNRLGSRAHLRDHAAGHVTLLDQALNLGQAEGALRATLGNLFALAEAYPDLKTNQTFQQLQTRISSLENAIADRREFYNESVNINNVRMEQFPDSIVAGMFGFKSAALLEFSAEEKADVDVGKLFKS